MAYVDTSLIVSALSNEAATAKAKAWLTVQTDPTFISEWTVPEVSSAFGLKLRTDRSISPSGRSVWRHSTSSSPTA